MRGSSCGNCFSARRQLALLLGIASLLVPTTVQARKPVSCDRLPRVSNNVIVETPNEKAIGRVCFFKGSQILVGPTPVELRGARSPDVPSVGCIGRTPAAGTRCAAAKEAVDQLRALLENGANCEAKVRTSANQWQADCVIDSTRSLAEEMIARGYACTTINDPTLVSAQVEARARGLGLWAPKWSRLSKSWPLKQCHSS